MKDETKVYMSEETPDRLKEFRADYRVPKGTRNASGAVRLGATVVGTVALVFIVQAGMDQYRPQPSDSAGLTADRHREYAVYLAENNQPEAAVRAYEDYLDKATLDDAARATVCYSVAKLAIDGEDYETALLYLYQAEMLDPESDLKPEITKKILLCLDKLGRSATLRRQIRKRSAVDDSGASPEPGSVVLAEFNGEPFTDRDLERELEKLPPAARGAIDTPEKKADFARNVLAQRLLVGKARRQNLDADPEIQEMLARQVDDLIVRKLIKDEVQSRLNVTPGDVKQFYQAEIARFSEPASASGKLAQGDTQAVATSGLSGEKAISVQIRGSRVAGGKIPAAAQRLLADKVLASEAGSATIESDGVWYAFAGTVTPGKVQPFAAVRDRAESMYRSQKERELVSALIEETLQASNVKVHMDRIAAMDDAP